LMLDNKTIEIEEKVTNLENNIPLFNVECKELQALVRKVGIKTLGGYKTPAYNDRSLRTKVYTDIQHQLKREFGVTRYEAIKRKQLDKAKEILASYTVPVYLKEEIFNTNNQEEWEC
ncbi:ORF6C domain-containing protein, partial [Clostridium botulinum]